MNKKRRNSIESINEQLSLLQSLIETIRDDEQEAYDNLPESFQEGEKRSKMQDAIENIESTLSSIDEAHEYLEESIQCQLVFTARPLKSRAVFKIRERNFFPKVTSPLLLLPHME